jgi:hypothetical protein
MTGFQLNYILTNSCFKLNIFRFYELFFLYKRTKAKRLESYPKSHGQNLNSCVGVLSITIATCVLHCRGCCFLTPSLVRASFISHSWLLLNLTGLNWRWLEIQKIHRIDRQTESGVRCVGHLGASFFYLYSLRPYSLQFFKTLLLKSSLKPCLQKGSRILISDHKL